MRGQGFDGALPAAFKRTSPTHSASGMRRCAFARGTYLHLRGLRMLQHQQVLVAVVAFGIVSAVDCAGDPSANTGQTAAGSSASVTAALTAAGSGDACSSDASSVLSFGVSPSATCAGVEETCQRTVMSLVGGCALSVNVAQPNASEGELNARILECASLDAAVVQAVGTSCLSCYTEAAACTVTYCLSECQGDPNPACDACRRTRGCDQQTYNCGGAANPFR